jgi:hypothetical protein
LETLFADLPDIFSIERIVPQNSLNQTGYNAEEGLQGSTVQKQPQTFVKPVHKNTFVPKSPFTNSKYGENPDLAVWYYLDEDNKTQGAFSCKQMDSWFNNNHLPNDLKIRYKENNQFIKLIDLLGKSEQPTTNYNPVKPAHQPHQNKPEHHQHQQGHQPIQRKQQEGGNVWEKVKNSNTATDKPAEDHSTGVFKRSEKTKEDLQKEHELKKAESDKTKSQQPQATHTQHQEEKKIESSTIAKSKSEGSEQPKAKQEAKTESKVEVTPTPSAEVVTKQSSAETQKKQEAPKAEVKATEPEEAKQTPAPVEKKAPDFSNEPSLLGAVSSKGKYVNYH